jgi:putative ABC transport system permease protein
MPVILRIALRNLLQHRSKSLIIGILIAVGILILVVGNSMIETAEDGIKKTFIETYTGNIMISGRSDGDVSLFGVRSIGGMEETPIIPDYEQVKTRLASMDGVESVTSQITGFGLLSIEENDDSEGTVFSMLFGIDPTTYWEMFDSIEIIEGSKFGSGEQGILLLSQKRDELEEEYEIEISIGDPVLVSGAGMSGFRIREVPLSGVFEFKQKAQGLDMVSYIDAQTLRALTGMSLSSLGDVTIDDTEKVLLTENNPDDLFADITFEVEDDDASRFSEEDILSLFDDDTDSADLFDSKSAEDTGTWHFILLDTGDSENNPASILQLSSTLQSEGFKVQAADWKQASGGFAATADVLKTVFNIAVLIVAIVAVIIIMNTLVISVTERTGEIGTMRALGAKKSFVWKMFLTETLTISIVFGIIGMILATVALKVIGAFNIEVTNPFLAILFAGGTIDPELSVKSLIYAFFIVIGIGFISHIYPVRIALKIQPIRAIQTD